ncbi:methionyl-tRNA formyltransferase [Shewanella kaireitica]|uniref:methionyl-tRNA formyltransferase n=1 Tax=Shewanella kaireitica TaxID=212021 RepID=UPI00200D8A78|nr:methionyl-tRNA formyltransferase [Shewanella kaireitica]MCL1093800.1 methionyl-tRNA formyltransferase [Shewanella kaireitica]
MNSYVVATIKEWNISQFEKRVGGYAGEWFLMNSRSELTIENLRKINPKYIFFPHWSWIVPDAILKEFNCVCFHMTDVPYGRGGSPLQNLIIRGHQKTKLTALKMANELDAGPVYLKNELCLTGSAAEIFLRSSSLTFDMIEHIVKREPNPVPQQGNVTEFPRRTPAQSLLTPELNLEGFYNTVRMLDADTYPKAYLNLGNLKLEFSGVSKIGSELEATVRVIKESE